MGKEAWNHVDWKLHDDCQRNPFRSIKPLKQDYWPSGRNVCGAQGDSEDERLPLRQPPVFEHDRDIQIAATEVTEHLCVVGGISARENQFTEALAVLAREAAVFLEPFECVVIEHLGPEVCVI